VIRRKKDAAAGVRGGVEGERKDVVDVEGARFSGEKEEEGGGGGGGGGV
jgi:hypothetical protein